MLNQTREDGDWEAWLMFFFEGVAVTADQAFDTTSRLTELFKTDSESIAGLGRASASASALHRYFQSHPVGSVRDARDSLHLSIPTLHSAARHLVRLGIPRELPTNGTTPLYAYGAYLDALNADSDSL